MAQMFLIGRMSAGWGREQPPQREKINRKCIFDLQTDSTEGLWASAPRQRTKCGEPTVCQENYSQIHIRLRWFELRSDISYITSLHAVVSHPDLYHLSWQIVQMLFIIHFIGQAWLYCSKFFCMVSLATGHIKKWLVLSGYLGFEVCMTFQKGSLKLANCCVSQHKDALNFIVFYRCVLAGSGCAVHEA